MWRLWVGGWWCLWVRVVPVGGWVRWCLVGGCRWYLWVAMEMPV